MSYMNFSEEATVQGTTILKLKDFLHQYHCIDYLAFERKQRIFQKKKITFTHFHNIVWHYKLYSHVGCDGIKPE